MEKRRYAFVFVIMVMLVAFTSAAMAAENSNSSNSKDIVETAKAAGDFKVLVAALETADLAETLKGEGPFTVFAPTDEAFAKLLKDLSVTEKELLKIDDLAAILKNHVIQGKVLSADLKNGMKLKTLAGKEVVISLDPVKVNDAKVIKPDIAASNGVIHAIDAALIP